VHFLQLVFRLINRNFATVLNPFGSDRDLGERQLSVPDLGRRFIKKKKITCMFVIPVGESCFGRPSLEKALDLLWVSKKVVPGFEGEVICAFSWSSEVPGVTQYTTNAFTITYRIFVSGGCQIN
jgi:hypothetical protein